MLLNVITVYLISFFSFTFLIYFFYTLLAVPFSYKLPLKLNNFLENLVNDYFVMILLLVIFSLINSAMFQIKHMLFYGMNMVISFTAIVFLASFIAKYLVNTFNMTQKSKTISYIILFILQLTLYSALILQN